jgi:hypothetical protein
MTYEQAFERARVRTAAGIPTVPSRSSTTPGGWRTHQVPPFTGLRGQYENRLRGEAWHQVRRRFATKVTEQHVREIRELYSAGAATQQEIGDCYGIGLVTVHCIVTRKTWKTVA